MEKTEGIFSTNYYYKISDFGIGQILLSRRIMHVAGEDINSQRDFLYQEDQRENFSTVKNIRKRNPFDLPLDLKYIYCALNDIQVDDIIIDDPVTMDCYIGISELVKKGTKKNFEHYFLISPNVIDIFAKRLGVPSLHLKLADFELFRKVVISKNKEYILENDDFLKRIERFTRIKNSKYRDHLADVYDSPLNTDNLIVSVIRETGHPIEEIILNFDDYPVDKLIERFGIFVPLKQKDKRIYVLENIANYKHVLTRKSLPFYTISEIYNKQLDEVKRYVQSLTDIEIVYKIFKVLVPFRSRNQLVANVLSALQEDTFMIPLDDIVQRAKNAKTAKITNNNSGPDYYIAYGTCKDFHVFTLSELYNLFAPDEKLGIIIFSNPLTKESFSNLNIIRLLRLLEHLDESNIYVSRLIERINQGQIDRAKLIDYKFYIKILTKRYNEKQANFIRTFLIKLYNLGKDIEEGIDEDEVEERVREIDEMLRVKDKLLSEFFKRFRTVDEGRSGVLVPMNNFLSRWEEFKDDPGSGDIGTELQDTSKYHMKLMFNERIEDF